jgi:hypothetical protein
MRKYKTAVVFTGSGGTISQEVAIVDQLIKSGKLTLDEEDTFLAATGTGAITLAAVNACFRKDNPCSWDTFYKEIFLESFSDEDVFLKVDPIHWITLPQRKKINELLHEAGFSTISDLPFDSAILATSIYGGKSSWIKSNSTKVKDLELSDIVMASSAIPVLFPTQQLNSVTGRLSTKFEGAHHEGAMLGILHKFRRLIKRIVLEHGTFEQLFIISPKRSYDYNLMIEHDLSLMLPQERFQFNQFLNNISLNGFLSFLIKIQKANSKRNIAKTISVSLPEFEPDYGLLDFSNQSEKYVTVRNWFENNPDRLALEIASFIKEIAFIPSFSDKYFSKSEFD